MRAWWSTAADGDQRELRDEGAVAPGPVPRGLPVRSLTQVHGNRVLVVGDRVPAGARQWKRGPAGLAPVGDALVSADPSACLVVLSADCASLALGSPEGVYGAVHVGWRGLLAGVVEQAAAEMRALGATELFGALGPTIGPCCYAFDPVDRAPLIERYGTALAATTSWGDPSLDLPTGVRGALGGAQVHLVHDGSTCTGCGPDAFSLRRRGDSARQALVVWREAG